MVEEEKEKEKYVRKVINLRFKNKFTIIKTKPEYLQSMWQ